MCIVDTAMKMNKRNILIFLIIPFTLIGCNKKDTQTRESEAPIDVDITTPIDEVKEEDYKKIPSYIYTKLNEYNSFKAVTEGQTVSTSIIEVTQIINSLAIKSEYSYLKNESHSKLVNTVHEAYYKDSKAVYRDGDSGDYSSSSLDDYLNVYGTYPFDAAIEGYLISEDCIVSVTKVSKNDQTYVFKAVFDNEKSTNNVKIQMKKFGGLDDYPTFDLIEMNFTINSDFTLQKIDLHSKYKAKKVLTTNCEQTYTVTYSNYNENIEVPNLDSVKPLFD